MQSKNLRVTSGTGQDFNKEGPLDLVQTYNPDVKVGFTLRASRVVENASACAVCRCVAFSHGSDARQSLAPLPPETPFFTSKGTFCDVLRKWRPLHLKPPADGGKTEFYAPRATSLSFKSVFPS